MPKRLHRREFLRASAISGGAIAAAGWLALPGKVASASPNEKLNIAVVGVAGRGAGQPAGVASQNIVALCDVDDQRLGAPPRSFLRPRPSTTSARCSTRWTSRSTRWWSARPTTPTPGRRHGHEDGQALLLREAADPHVLRGPHLGSTWPAENKLATQMGTQIHAGDNYRRVVELVQAGRDRARSARSTSGCGKGWGGGERPEDTPARPAGPRLGPVARPGPVPALSSRYVPANWRRWWDFGNGDAGRLWLPLHGPALLGLEAAASRRRSRPRARRVHPETCPLALIVRYEFPARGDLPPVKLTWYDGEQPARQRCQRRKMPERKSRRAVRRPARGCCWPTTARASCCPRRSSPTSSRREPTIPDSIGHHEEWIEACKTGGPTTCNFDYSGALTEAVLLGNVAYRAGKKLQWDAVQLKAANCPEADASSAVSTVKAGPCSGSLIVRRENALELGKRSRTVGGTSHKSHGASERTGTV